MKNLLISTFAPAVMLLFGGVNEVNADPLTYKIEGETVTIIDCLRYATSPVVIPSAYEGKPVTSIGKSAFSGCVNLTSVTIPDSVSSIQPFAFEYCGSLTSVTIPDSVTSIGGRAFYLCSGLTSVTIPDSVTSIGYSAFYDCSSLKSVTIPDSVTSIGAHAFWDCRNLTDVTIGNSVTSIGQEAFYHCKSLTSVTIPDSVTSSIGYRAFYECSSLTSVTIGNSVTSIGYSAFEECHGLTSVTIGKSVTSIEKQAFYGCSSLTSVTIPDSVTSIGERAFYVCSGLTSIIFEDNAPSLGDDVFSWNSNAKIFVNPGATGFGEKFAGLPVVIKANTAIYLDGEYSNGKDVKKAEFATVSLFTHFPQGEIFYTLDGTKPTFTSAPYTAPFQLTESATIRAIAYSADFTNSIEAEPVSLRLLPAYSMNVSTAGGGTAIITPPDGPYLEGTEVTVTAKPEGNWEFIGWSGDSTSSEATITITMDEAKALTPTFGTNVTLNEIGAGKVVQTPSNPVPYGSTVTFTAKPDIGHYLFRWAGEQTGNDNPTQLQVTKPNPVVSGLFVLSPVPDIIQINAVSKTDSLFTISFETKSDSTYTIEVTQDFKQWSEIGEVQGTGSSVKFTDPRLPIVPFKRNYFRVKLLE
ncbi:leucine-rich repeat protein [bacterium]|nr:leucine-rich repeat protein [bacterium]